ncbi:hypothetical protein EV363DRAFT_1226778 [Boletus edulis]|nr:hypothetical protein EV363DRAFT_1226778 [Boletus edulis]
MDSMHSRGAPSQTIRLSPSSQVFRIRSLGSIIFLLAPLRVSVSTQWSTTIHVGPARACKSNEWSITCFFCARPLPSRLTGSQGFFFFFAT